MKNYIIAGRGSIQYVPNIPTEIKALYKTVWEILQRKIIEMAADRGAFIDQSQSLNIHIKEPTIGKITSMHFAGWKLGLKTGMYYLRTMAASAPIQFTVDQEALKVIEATATPTLGRKSITTSPKDVAVVAATRKGESMSNKPPCNSFKTASEPEVFSEGLISDGLGESMEKEIISPEGGTGVDTI